MTDDQVVELFARIVRRILQGPSACIAPALRELHAKLHDAVMNPPEPPAELPEAAE